MRANRELLEFSVGQSNAVAALTAENDRLNALVENLTKEVAIMSCMQMIIDARADRMMSQPVHRNPPRSMPEIN